ncbi:hypothetical protein JVU11DRAFT_11734 [Chiua virens]|nr:hypothetical protein JVU11DRAFT_11734 [Chiua virens]
MGSATGLAGAANKALKSYRGAGNHLNIARASLGRRVALPGSPRQEALFKSELAKTIFLCVATVGDDLRSQHAAWQARLQSDIETASLSGGSSKDISKIKGIDSGDLVDSGFHVSRFQAMLIKRLSLWGERDRRFGIPTHGKRPWPALGSKENARAQGGQRNARTDAETLDDIYTPGEQNTSNPTSDTTALTPDTIGPFSSVSTIVDPRVYRFREQIARSDEARRVLMDWCRAWTTDFLCPLEATLGAGIESEATSPAQASTVGTDCALTLVPDVEPVDSDRSLSIVATSSSREVTTQGRSGDDDETIAYEMAIWISSKQEELKEKWLMARQRCRSVNRKERPVEINLTLFDQTT